MHPVLFPDRADKPPRGKDVYFEQKAEACLSASAGGCRRPAATPQPLRPRGSPVYA